MRIPFTVFGIDEHGAAVTAGLMVQWPHLDHPSGFLVHLPLRKLDARGMVYTCRLLGSFVFARLSMTHPDTIGKLDVRLPTPVGDERFCTDDDNVKELIANPDFMRDLRVAVGLSDSALRLVIAGHDKEQTVDIGRSVALLDLDAMGAEKANLSIGETVLHTLIEQHADVFARYPHLSI